MIETVSADAALRTWLTRSRYTASELSRRLGITRQYMSYLLQGRFTPGLRLAVRIERLTGVPASSWITPTNDEGIKKAKG